MSADNGIYILITPSFWSKIFPILKNSEQYNKEYRVAHLQAIENIDWDWTRGSGEEDHENIMIKNARKMWKDCKVCYNKKAAYKEARELEKKYGWTEYGICEIEVDRVF